MQSIGSRWRNHLTVPPLSLRNLATSSSYWCSLSARVGSFQGTRTPPSPSLSRSSYSTSSSSTRTAIHSYLALRYLARARVSRRRRRGFFFAVARATSRSWTPDESSLCRPADELLFFFQYFSEPENMMFVKFVRGQPLGSGSVFLFGKKINK